MKGLALSGLLFCALVAVLVLAASNGVGARDSNVAPVRFGALEQKSQTIESHGPVVQVETNSISPSARLLAIPPPEIKVSRVRRRPHSSKKPVSTKAPQEATPKPVVTKTVVATKATAPKPRVVIQEAPASPAVITPEPTFHPRDITDDGPKSRADADKEWQHETLERWRREADERESTSSTRVNSQPAGQDSELKGTPAEGLYPADNAKDSSKKKKRRRHRFLFIRW